MRGYTITHPVQFRGLCYRQMYGSFLLLRFHHPTTLYRASFAPPLCHVGFFYCLMSGRYPAVVAPVPWQMSFVAMAGYSCTPCRTVATRTTVSGCLTHPAQGFTPISRRNALTASANLFAFSESPVARTRTGSAPEIPLSSDLHLPHLSQNCVLHDLSLESEY